MARSKRDIEAYLAGLNKSWELVDDSTYVIRSGEDTAAVVMRITETVLVCRVTIANTPADNQQTELRLFRKLLELNATELLYSSYGLDGDQIVLSSALELENLDLNELEAVLADMDLALLRHVPTLREMVRETTEQ